MASQKTVYDITWTQFELCNSNPQVAFENMCRWLFNEFFFGGKALLHSDPNNPGVEVVPVTHPDSKERISFQAKYFDSMDYEQIKHSARTTVSHYAGDLDVVYLYCNKDVTTSSQGYLAVESILKPAGITIRLITNQEILQQVMKNETIAWHYFNQISLTETWFQQKLQICLASLGPRYNDEFNVLTPAEELFNFFLCNADAVNAINLIKNNKISKLKKNRREYCSCPGLVGNIIAALEALEDVSLSDVTACLSWPDRIKETCSDAFCEIEEIIKHKKSEWRDAENRNDHDRTSRISAEINSLNGLLELPYQIVPEIYPRSVMRSQVMVIKGNAGVGKSQMLAVETEKLVSSGIGAILLLGTNFINEHAIHIQATEVLAVDLSMDALLHKLEGLGIQNGTYSYLFIDAINESTYRGIWKAGLGSLFTKIKSYPHVKLAISVRTGYEKLVFDDAVNSAIANSDVASIVHNGFRETSIKATLTFLNHYGIPFLPSYYLQSEMTNPLFLKLFCENYSGENFDMFSLFEKLISKADEEARIAVGIADSFPILHKLVDEIAAFRLATDSFPISQDDLFDLGFWNRYGLSTKKTSYIASLVRSGLLIGTASEFTESFYLGYNLLEDFVCAKTVLRSHPNKSDLISYLQTDLLKIEEGTITKLYNVDIFIVLCGLFAEKYHEECFEALEQLITDEYDKDDISRRYLESFLWRKASSVNADHFIEFINSHSADRDIVFRILIENSTKEHHPLNALFLHNILISKSLVHRDALWTTYINNLSDDEERIFQLITYFDEGKLLDGLTKANTELILILLTWLLTASNRFLRDKASKSAIELLKYDISLCKPLLQRFETVNDPYVSQRLLGNIFGACLKRISDQKETYRELAEYVYSQVFNQEYVFPDVLLRDYARLILERWLHEYPEDSSFIEREKIMPPYHSLPIPVVDREEYYDSIPGNGGFNSIDMSMRINHADCPGIYGDFGRYTFQAALDHFEDVDVVNMYHYCMQYIRDELGYNMALGAYDSAPKYYRYDRHLTKKIERIGKKYQWIAFHNILARVSDTHHVKDWGIDPYSFEGPWEPYVRDFDPTLNKNSMVDLNTPSIEYPSAIDEFLPIDPDPSGADIKKWTQTKPVFFCSIPSKLMLSNEESGTWVNLYLHDFMKNEALGISSNSIGFQKGSQQIWLSAQACFVHQAQFDTINKHINSPEFSEENFPEGGNVYQLFNREYAWSPGYRSVFKDSWMDYEIETGEYKIEKEILEMPDYSNIEHDGEGNIIIPFVKKEFERRIPEDTIHIPIMPAYSRVLWEEEYDASQDESTAFYVPCRALIDFLQLEQKQADGYYYSKDDELVCFDGSLPGICEGLLIRADYLKKFLDENGLKVIWTCIAEKQYFLGDLHQEWSRWQGFYHLEGTQIYGDIAIGRSQ